MPWKPEEVHNLLIECGELALEIQESAGQRIKADNTIVTEADTRIEDRITRALSGDPNLHFIGEETSRSMGDGYHQAALKGETYITDPVDGTVLYANGLPGWGISLGYMRDGVLSEGGVLFPLSGQIYVSDGDRVLSGIAPGRVGPDYRDLVELPVPSPGETSPVICVSQTLIKFGSYRGNYTALSTGSCVSSMLYLLTGGSIGYVTRTSLWDLAAFMPMLFKLGFRAFRRDGEEMGLKVDERHWHIPPVDHRHHWKMKDHVLFCRDRESFDRIMPDCIIPE